MSATNEGTSDSLSLNHQVLTIAARNYISRTAVLAKSYAAHHPGRKLAILLVDADPGLVPESDYFHIVTPGDLPLDTDEVRRMAMIYEITEFCTSLKPWALQMLLDRGADVATYLDPDIEVFSSLDGLAEAAASSSIALTPHTLHPFPRDGLQPTESDIMLAGTFNLGYISVSQDARPMLDWWKERLGRHSVIAPERGVFVDQRWVDLVPSYFKHAVVREPGYNVAYWNLHERKLTTEQNRVLVNGSPLRFFHFSGYRTDQPWILNKYYSWRPRVLLSENLAVYSLCEEYRRRLSNAEAEYGSVDEPYGFGFLGDGTPVTERLRQMYREALVTAEDTGDVVPPVPFVEDDSRLVAWLQAPAQAASRITNYVYRLWRVRPDLQLAFPEPLGVNEGDLAAWALRPDSDVPAEFAIPLREVLGGGTSALPVTVESTAGVNVTGYFKAELGVGEAGRQLLDAVRRSGLPFRADVSTATANRQNENVDLESSDLVYPISVAAINADVFGKWATTTGADLARSTYLVGQWAWELEDFDDPSGSLELVDEVWGISEFVRDAVEKKTSKPVYAIPLAVRRPIDGLKLDRSAIGIPNSPYFLFTFDFASIFERKNPLAVVDAFKTAFPLQSGCNLVIKSINGKNIPSDRERLRLACVGRPDIFLVEEYLDSDQVGALMNEAVAYVSLHRSEGLGFTMAEAMAYGKPVIATAYSANVEFMNEDNSLLVPYRLVEVGPGCDPYPPSARWADPDVQAAARYMTWVVENPDEAKSLGERARQSILSERTVDRAAEFVRRRVDEIFTSGRVARISSQEPMQILGDRGTNPGEWAMQKVHTPPDVISRSRFPKIAKRYRQLVFRALAHHDQRVNEQLTALGQAMAEVHSKDTDRENVLRAQDQLLADRLSRLATGSDETKERFRETNDRFRELDQRLIEMNLTLRQIDQEMVARPYTAVPNAGTYIDDAGSRVMGYRPGDSSLRSYADFEDTYRGTEDTVASMLKPYVGLLGGHEPILEIGSGRGELLELMRAEGMEAFGVDIDESMYARGVEKGLDVRLGDGIDFLGNQPKSSLGAVISVEVVEHMQVAVLDEFIGLSFDALRRGGLFVAETVNPHSPPALKAFWLDITHVRPLYPESLLSLAQQAGFESARIFFPSGSGDLDQDLRLSGSYALVAMKGIGH